MFEILVVACLGILGFIFRRRFRSCALAPLVLLVVLAIVSDAQAIGFRRRCGGGCGTGCSSSSQGCNISGRRDSATEADAAQQLIEQETAPKAAASAASTSYMPPKARRLQIDRNAALEWCAVPRDQFNFEGRQVFVAKK